MTDCIYHADGFHRTLILSRILSADQVEHTCACGKRAEFAAFAGFDTSLLKWSGEVDGVEIIDLDRFAVFDQIER